MSLNFSIESILRHSNVETSSNSTLIGPGGLSGLNKLNKLNQTSFLDESTSAFLKRQQLNYLNNNLKNSNTNSTSSSSTNSQIINSNHLNETGNSNFLQSQLFYLNNLNQLNNLNKQNLIDDLAINGSANPTTTANSFASLELNHLNPVLQNQLNQFHNQFQNQLIRSNYLNKLNSIYGNDHLSSSNSFKNLNNQQNEHTKQQISLNENGNASMTLLSQGSESQCSPLSDKSGEMLLNYDSSESQLSGNNVSINSNSSFRSNQNSRSAREDDKDKVPLCTKCKLHGMRNVVKGHKKNCPKKDCNCKLCSLTDYGKLLRGKKGKKGVAQLAASAGLTSGLNKLNNLNNLNGNISSLNNHSHQKAKNINLPSIITPVTSNAQQAASLLMNMNNLNEKQLTNLNNDNSGLLVGLQSSTPNSNSNSSCSSISMTAALASLNKHDLPLPSTNLNNLNNLNQATAALTNEQLAVLEKSTIKDYMKIVTNILKEKLAQDGLNYEKELSKLKFAVIYILMNRFEDKGELYNKFLMDS